MGNAKAYNMIVLGAFLKVKPIVKMENVTAGLKKSLPPRHHNLIPMNEQAIKVGPSRSGWKPPLRSANRLPAQTLKNPAETPLSAGFFISHFRLLRLFAIKKFDCK